MAAVLALARFRWNPHSSASSPMFRYKVGLNAALQVLGNSNDVAIDGGSPDSQDRKQTGVYVGQDLTFTGLAGHTMKGGAKIKAMKYELGGTSRSVDIVETLIDRTTGMPCRISVDTAASMRRPPKAIDTPCTLSSGSVMAPPPGLDHRAPDAGQAARQEHHDQHQHKDGRRLDQAQGD